MSFSGDVRGPGFSEADLRVLADFTDGGRTMREAAAAHSGDARVRIGGFVQKVLGKHHVMMPAVNMTVAEAVVLAAGEAREDMLTELLQSHPDKSWVAQFARDRCVVPVPGRPGVFTVETRIPGLTESSLDDYSDDVKTVPPVFTDVRKYSLDQFFSDEDVIDKFPLSEKFLQTARRCAVEKPRAAAEMIQKALRARGYTGVQVLASKYIKSKKRAAEFIVQATKKLRDRDAGVWSRTVAGKIFYYHDDGFEVLRWSVEGPLTHALEVKCVYDLCLAVGLQEAVQMLSLETAMLGIAVRDEIEGSYVSGLLEGHVDLDGIEPLGQHIAPGLTTDQHSALSAMHDRVLPVTMGDRVVASAVRVTEKYALVCDHVLVESEDVSGLRLATSEFRQQRTVGNDLWVVAADGALHTAWSLREGRVGERVALVYSVGDRLEVTSPVAVSAVNGMDLALTAPSQLRKGMSGAAVVALSDMALLGVYRGETAGRAVVTAFGPEKYGDLADVELTSQASVAGRVDADDVAARFARRGYSAAFRAAAASVAPLYGSSGLRGVGVCYGDRLVTPLDPDEDVLRMGAMTGRAPTFDATDDGRFMAVVDGAEVASVPVQGRATVDHRVVILAKDADGVYMSEVCTVRQVGVSAKRFYIDAPDYEVGMPLVGGLVLSYDTAAVLGQYCGKAPDVGGSKGVCVSSFRPPAPVFAAPRSVEERLSEKFPMLTPIAWEVGAVKKVFSHPSGATYTTSRAIIGDSVMKIVAVREMERAGWSPSVWTLSVSRWQNNAALAKVASELGLDAMMDVGHGYTVPPGSKRLADLVEALVGLAWMHEKWSVVVEFCKALGVVPRDQEDEGGFTPVVSGFPLAVSPEVEREKLVPGASDSSG